jgi:casein kinase II subunit alpha
MQKIGRGRYSEVFQGVDITTNKFVVIKILKPVKRLKIRREIKILEAMRGCPHAVELLDVVTDPSNGTPSLIFNYIRNDEFRDVF